jgi:hypothetical protein
MQLKLKTYKALELRKHCIQLTQYQGFEACKLQHLRNYILEKVSQICNRMFVKYAIKSRL